MKSQLGHIQVNVDPQNLAFYKELFEFLGWTVCHQEDKVLGLVDKNGASVWFVEGLQQAANDYDGVGMNHLAIAVDAQKEVDQAVEYLKGHNIAALFDTPRHRPEFCGSTNQTYYQVMFESPDRVLLEVVYTGPIAS